MHVMLGGTGPNMENRIRFITYQKKTILQVDLSHCAAPEIQDVLHHLPEIVMAQPRKSVLIFADLTGAHFDDETLRVMKETAVFDKPYVKKTAWIGADYLPWEYYTKLKGFAGRDFPAFTTRDSALTWLVTD